MKNESHYRRLEQMYLNAPINLIFNPVINISEGHCEISMQVEEAFHHAAHALHGSVYFKNLDDAAFFAVNSIVTNVFVLTASFHVRFLRPVSSGIIIARGSVTRQSENKFEAKSEMYNEEEKIIATGEGLFVRSKILLDSSLGY